jgi:hypothetical protein
MNRRRIVMSPADLPKSQPVASKAGPPAVKQLPATVRRELMDRLIARRVRTTVRRTSAYEPKGADQIAAASIFEKTHGVSPSLPDLLAFMEVDRQWHFDPRKQFVSALGTGSSLSASIAMLPRDSRDADLGELAAQLSGSQGKAWLQLQLNIPVDRIAAGEIGRVIAMDAVGCLAMLTLQLPEHFKTQSLRWCGHEPYPVDYAPLAVAAGGRPEYPKRYQDSPHYSTYYSNYLNMPAVGTYHDGMIVVPPVQIGSQGAANYHHDAVDAIIMLMGIPAAMAGGSGPILKDV